MSQDVFKAPRAKRNHKSELKGWSPAKRRRTKEDFFSFCNIVLQYTQYEAMKQEEMRARNNTSPLDSGGSTAESYSEESTSSFMEAENDENRSSTTDQEVSRPSEMDSGDEDSYELITCFCMKPFAGRPMIECSECLTWIHLSCAKIRKSNIPDDFICQRCRESKFTTRKSSRIRSEKKMVNA